MAAKPVKEIVWKYITSKIILVNVMLSKAKHLYDGIGDPSLHSG
jgi:hypothetical protein